jgi:hypothetical protein
MGKKGDSQLPLDLPAPQAKIRNPSAEQISTRSAQAHSTHISSKDRVYSFSEKKVEREKNESAKHFHAILQLVRQFK